jgi:Ca2+:H+ antiporter
MRNPDKVKRQARKEAWYDRPGEEPSYNPFKRSRTWQHQPHTNSLDVEMGTEGMRSISRHSSEPGGRVNKHDEPIDQFESAPLEQGAGPSTSPEFDEKANGRTPEPSTETMLPSRTSSGRQVPAEQNARQRFINKFRKSDGNSGDDGEELERSKTARSSKKSLKHKKFTVASQLKATVFNSWINVLILAAPVGIALNYVPGIPPIAVFLVNFIAIVPLAALLSFATEEIALRVGETLGGLLNASFGNAVELIVAILALVKGEVLIVQTSLIGSILSNLLLVMGMCFFFGGLRRTEQFFNITVAQTAASLLALAVASIIIPTAFDLGSTTTNVPIAAISRGTAVILLVVYGCYLYFQLHTHAAMYQEEGQKVAARPRKHAIPDGGIKKALAAAGGIGAAQGRVGTGLEGGRPPNDELFHAGALDDEDDEADEPQLHIWVAIATLGCATAIIALCAEFMVGSINSITTQYNISQEFVGLILLPIVGNAAEHATAVTVACKDKMDLAIGVAVGSSMQIALVRFLYSHRTLTTLLINPSAGHSFRCHSRLDSG